MSFLNNDLKVSRREEGEKRLHAERERPHLERDKRECSVSADCSACPRSEERMNCLKGAGRRSTDQGKERDENQKKKERGGRRTSEGANVKSDDGGKEERDKKEGRRSDCREFSGTSRRAKTKRV